MWATKVVLDQGLWPAGDIVFHVVSDEEVVGNGTREIVERAPAADVTLSLEPTELTIGPFELQILEPMGRTRLARIDPRYFARRELLAFLARLAEADLALSAVAAAHRRRPRRTGKPL